MVEVFKSNTNNLNIFIWYQVFLSNTNNFCTDLIDSNILVKLQDNLTKIFNKLTQGY